ncbi:class I SAM-dependent methyltransferase [Kitasatospora sp. NPDC101157]|uniref:class I SAM-dependent methyltransferase n=1 Tax=Kitasatospora sp. NPDC101157 TaxID=3364098 RepID=UPI00380C3B3C
MKLDTLNPDDPGWRLLAAGLREAGYRTGTVRELLGVDEPVERILGDSGRFSYFYLEELAGHRDAVAVLARLFLFAGEVAAEELDPLPRPLLDLLWERELIRADPADPSAVHATVCLVEYRGRYVLSDLLFENRSTGFTVHDDSSLCMPLHSSSLELVEALRAPADARSFLDVGCGSGCQSLLLGEGYGRRTGFDPNPRAVGFARLNAAVNGVEACFEVAGWETFRDAPYDHIAFNAPDTAAAFDYINDLGQGLDTMLSATGHAQIRIVSEVTAQEGDWAGALAARIPEMGRWEVDMLMHADSPFGLAPEAVRSGKLPYGSLVVDHPSKTEEFWAGIAERQVVEIVVSTLTMRRRP